MGIFMGKDERQITAEVRAAHGGADQQLARYQETRGVLPAAKAERVGDLMMAVFLNSKIPWRSPARVDALNELCTLLGGSPYAYEAALNYWPVAKSARMNNWIAP